MTDQVTFDSKAWQRLVDRDRFDAAGELVREVLVCAQDARAQLRTAYQACGKDIGWVLVSQIAFADVPEGAGLLWEIYLDLARPYDHRAEAAVGLARRRDPGIEPYLVQDLTSRSPALQYAAMYALSPCGGPDSVPAMLRKGSKLLSRPIRVNGRHVRTEIDVLLVCLNVIRSGTPARVAELADLLRRRRDHLSAQERAWLGELWPSLDGGLDAPQAAAIARWLDGRYRPSWPEGMSELAHLPDDHVDPPS